MLFKYRYQFHDNKINNSGVWRKSPYHDFSNTSALVISPSASARFKFLILSNPRSYLALTSLVSSNRVAVSMDIFLHSQTETPAIGHTRSALLYADLKPFIFPSRYIGYWQSLLSPLCPWTGAKADARKDLWTEWCDLCLSSSCYTVSLSVYFSVDSNEELVGQCSNLDFWVCGQSMSIFCSSPLFSQMLVLCFPTG